MGYDHAMFGFSPCRAYWRDDVGSRAARSTHEGQMVAKFVDIGEIQTCDECCVYGVLTLVKIHDNKNPTYMLTKALIAENLELCLASVGQGSTQGDRAPNELARVELPNELDKGIKCPINSWELKGLELLNHVRDSEVKLFIKELYRQWIQNGDRPLLVEMKEKCWHLAANVMVSTVAGERYFGTVTNDYESRQCRKALGDFLYLSGIFMGGGSGAGKLGGGARLEKGLGSMNEADQDFECFWMVNSPIMTMTLSLRRLAWSHITGSKDQHGCNVDVDSYIGGFDSTVITLTSALSLLMNNPSTLKRAQDELDIKVGKHRKVDESDIKNLVYLQAIIKETLRLYPAAPLSVPREAMEDCNVAGFHIQAGTRLLVNLWKLPGTPKFGRTFGVPTWGVPNEACGF
ncbi:Cytochrome P450 82C4 [Vitis vinifera]|uniref:Cytochrome P450 82C4 n=1 Tax=Vitis vinifera TaxID=29760 RepID=A0A438JT13_VITVI|nr:Cytochrome P450 82C4 [Vitis vinifera]